MRFLSGILALVGSPALAAEVVWLAEGESARAIEAQILAQAKPTRPMLTVEALLGAEGDRRLADRAPHDALEQAIQSVRAFEARLDGELVIMEDLERALARVEVLASDADRDRVFRALTYQGFAVHRFFEGTLAKDPRAAAYRIELNDLAWVGPWASALALEPTRELTPYDIAESPQRIAYGEQARTYGREVLPGTLAVDGSGWLERGGELFIDGRKVKDTAAKLLPGPHWVHLVVGGHVVDTSRVQVARGATTTWTPAQTAEAWTSWVAAVRRGETPEADAATQRDVRALGGEVWFVVDSGKQAKILALSVAADGGSTWREVEVDAPSNRGDSNQKDGFSLAAGLGAGWMYSGDFYTQNPGVAPHTVGTVNSVALDLDVQGALDAGLVRVAVGLDTLLTPGEHHVALAGDSALRVRPTPYLGVGVRYAQAQIGYVLPYHLAFGAAGAVPITGGLEVQARLWLAPAGTLQRSSGGEYQKSGLSVAQIGLGWRIRP